MSLTKVEYNYNELAKLTSAGFSRALFPQIRDALTKRMMEIYGNDIDVSSASADGQLIGTQALIYDKIYQILENVYMDINPNVASGQWLDILCSYSNIQRLAATKSTCNILVKNISNVSQTPNSITAIDKNNNEWVWYNPKNSLGVSEVTWAADSVISVEFSCSKTGPIGAAGDPNPSTPVDWNTDPRDRGDIYEPIEFGIFDIYQVEDAIQGRDTESDASLRSRRCNYGGFDTVTVQSGLLAALLNNGNIDDCLVFNNVTGNAIDLKDGLNVANHNIAVVVKYKDGISNTNDILDSSIAKIIFNKLTPGIVTEPKPITANQPHFGTYKEFNMPLLNNLSTKITWKEASPFRLQAQIVLNKNTGYDATTTEPLIKEAIVDYYKNIRLGEAPNITDLIQKILAVDPKYNGAPTYYNVSGQFEGPVWVGSLPEGATAITATYDANGNLISGGSIVHFTGANIYYSITGYKGYITNVGGVGAVYQPINTYVTTDTNHVVITPSTTDDTITITVNYTV